MIAPVYAGRHRRAGLLLMLAGDRPFVALCHAMATFSTSGISPVGGIERSALRVLGEAAIAVFLSPPSHRGSSLSFRQGHAELPRPAGPAHADLGARRHPAALRAQLHRRLRDRPAGQLRRRGQAIWGSLFTVLSFLTTTGFESRHWQTMQVWSRLGAPGIILLGVAAMGGGIATTAGGIKLLRLYALYRHGLREMDLLVHPEWYRAAGPGEAA
jgi:trk system potassium uptake protein